MSETDIRHRRNQFETPERRSYNDDIQAVDSGEHTAKGAVKKGVHPFGRAKLISSYQLLVRLGIGCLIVPVMLRWWMAVFSSSESNSKNAGMQEHDTLVLSSTPNSTLALLYPPGLLGGYRNQVLRFAALAHYAQQYNLTLFLPSLWWSTQIRISTSLQEPAGLGNNNATPRSARHQLQWYPVPMDLLFDIDGWNAYASTHPNSIPRMVTQIRNSDCWSSTSVLEELSNVTLPPAPVDNNLYHLLQRRGSLIQLSNWTRHLLAPGPTPKDDYNPRLSDLLPMVSQCQHPRVYGGGKRAGKLWNDYLSLVKRDPHPPILAHVLKALQLLPQWRKVGTQYCLNNNEKATHHRALMPQPYVALHARIEVEMMAHPCGAQMERNLSIILNHVGSFLNDRSEFSSRRPTLFVAVSREGIADARFPQFLDLATHNLHTLNEYAGNPAGSIPSFKKLLHDQYPVVECGGAMMKRYFAAAAAGTNRRPSNQYADVDFGTLLEQVINFDLAVQAEIFIGVDGSSYSNAVWTTRYHLGKGSGNYRYSTSGLDAVEGLPKPHGNCRRPRKPMKQ